MALLIPLSLAKKKLREAKTLADIEQLFIEAFGIKSVPIDESSEDDSFKQILDVVRQHPMQLIVAAKGANPYFLHGGGYTKNCQRCIAVFEMRRRGYAVIAKPKITQASEDGIYSSQNCFKNPVIIGKRGGRGQKALDKSMLMQYLQALPDGARAAVCWTKLGDGERGHTIACEKQNGLIIFIDPQTGNVGKTVLGDANKDGYSFFRMDNLDFDEQKLPFIAEGKLP